MRVFDRFTSLPAKCWQFYLTDASWRICASALSRPMARKLGTLITINTSGRRCVLNGGSTDAEGTRRVRAMELDKAIAGRRSVREYRREPVAQRTVEQLIYAAVQAPSAINEQLWTFTVVRDAALLDRLSQEAKRHLLATVVAGPQAERLQAMLREPSFQIFYHAPVLVLISAASASPWAKEDCALAAENLMLAAYAAGLGSCWIGFAQAYLDTPAGKQLLGLPADCVPVAPIIVGHPKSPPPPVPRKPPQVRWVG